MGFRGQYRNKRDANEPSVVKAFQAFGATVTRMDVPADLLVGYLGQTYLVEVKQEKTDLNDNQKRFRDNWRGQFCVVRTVADVQALIREWNETDREIQRMRAG